MVLSVLVALVLTPALCATILRPHPGRGAAATGGLFGGFNRWFTRATGRYASGVDGMLRRGGRFLLLYVALVAVMAVLFARIPTAFFPDEDAGTLNVIVQAPPGATRERTNAALLQAQEHFLQQEKDNIRSVMTISGFNFAGTGQNMGLVFVRLKDWNLRGRDDQSVRAIAQRAQRALASVRDASMIVVVPPAVSELGNASGFDLMLQDRGGVGRDTLLAARNQLLGLAAREPALAGVRPNGIEDAPQLALDIDRERALALGLSLAEVNQTLSVAWGAGYVNDFIDRGRIKKVYLQGDAAARMQPDDLARWHVRNARGEMVPFSAFASARWTFGPQKLVRYNGVPSFNLQGQAAPGYSTGDAMQAMERLVAQLPPGIGLEWTGVSYEERTAGRMAPLLYALSLAVVFLALAALYESWLIPAVVLLVVPLGVLGAVVATLARGMSNDIFFQVGLLTTMGLSAKSAILIVEFAKTFHDEGMSLREAVLAAARQRLRPILMTSLAFMFGVLPLAVASGAGSGAQNAVGTGVIGGMLASTVLALYFTPLLFVQLLRWREKRAVS
jgi:multidrug efflux pump